MDTHRNSAFSHNPWEESSDSESESLEYSKELPKYN